MSTAGRVQGLDPDETKDIRQLIGEVIPRPDDWLITPHELLGGQKPGDLLGTEQEIRVRELARAFKHGIFT